jgi:FkbM family methyltransferase
MAFLESLRKPQYVLRPRWAVRRILAKAGFSKAAGASGAIELPWGTSLYIDEKDTVGRALAAQGLYDVVTTEVLWRLIDDGATVFDIGANIGYFTTLLAHRAGPNGRVVAFEPHPETFRFLQKNVAQIKHRNVRIENVALSDVEGEGALDNFLNEEGNTSYAFLTNEPSSRALTVKMVRGERYLEQRPSLMKVDAQWHEASVLAGFGAALRDGSIRDIVFEEDAPYPAPSHKILLDAGYKLLWFDQRLSGPIVISPDQKPTGIQPYEVLPSYLATRDEERARNLLSKRGWQSLKSRAAA